jgi:hypothetical protein
MDDRPRGSWLSLGGALLVALVLAAATGGAGCSGPSRLTFVDPAAPVVPQDIKAAQDSARRSPGPNASRPAEVLQAMFADTILGFRAGTADTSKRYLGRLRAGLVADTLNVILMGDNRPSYRSTKLRNNLVPIREMLSLNPVKWAKGLVNIPIVLARGTFPDFAMWRDIPAVITKKPTYGREVQVLQAIEARRDSLESRGQSLAMVINNGDLVKDGRRGDQWARFLGLIKPITDRTPYFPIAGNHERTDDTLGIANWHTATGLSISGNLLHYCFDSADGWVRFIALDSNPMVDQYDVYSREDEVLATNVQIAWLIERLKEHNGPAVVFMHHPPFCVGFHRTEWQSDSLLSARRLQMVKALQDAGLSVLVTSHEHAYERALLRCGDAVMINIVTGGAGSPLHTIPTGPEAAAMFASYDIPGCQFKAEDVVTDITFHYIHLRLWYGGGEFYTYAVDQNGKDKLIDHVEIDLKRFGIPQIDQEKMPIPTPSGPKQPPPKEETTSKQPNAGTADTTKAVKPSPKPSDRAKSRTR